MDEHVFDLCPHHPESDPHCKQCGEAAIHQWHVEEFDLYAKEVLAKAKPKKKPHNKDRS